MNSPFSPLNAHYVARVIFLTTKLGNWTNHHSCPVELQFQAKILAKLFVGKENTIAATRGFGDTKLTTDEETTPKNHHLNFT